MKNLPTTTAACFTCNPRVPSQRLLDVAQQSPGPNWSVRSLATHAGTAAPCPYGLRTGESVIPFCLRIEMKSIIHPFHIILTVGSSCSPTKKISTRPVRCILFPVITSHNTESIPPHAPALKTKRAPPKGRPPTYHQQ